MYNTRVLVIYHCSVATHGYELFFALCDLLLYPFVPLYYIGITGNVDIAIILVHSLLYVNWYFYPFCIGNALIIWL